MDNTPFVSSSPHVHSGASTARIMWTVSAALSPAAIWSIYLFGVPALSVIASTIVFCLAAEAVCQRVAGKPVSVRDGSAFLTGLLLALNLPPGIPLWMCFVGALVAIPIAKAAFGGLGQNPFNPALTARVFMLIAFPAQMTRWLVPRGTGETLFGHATAAWNAAGAAVPLSAADVDAITAATPLGLLREKGVAAVAALDGSTDFFIGRINGSLGETSALLLLLGGVFLLWRRVITWHIPVSFLATVAAFAAALHAYDGAHYASAPFHLFAGGLMIGAWFMATDYVTSPMHPLGKILFGVGCGLVTMVIRTFGGYPEGVSFAILLMNALTPILDRVTRPRKFGLARVAATQGGA